MQRVPVWKIVFIACVLLVSLFMLYPSMKYYKAAPIDRLTDEMRELANDVIKLGLDLQGGVHLVIEVDLEKYEEILRGQGKTEDEIDYAMSTVLDSASAVIESRVDQFGVAEASIIKQPPDRIVLEMPGFDNPQQVEELVQADAALSFHLLPDKTVLGEVLGDIDDAVDEDFAGMMAKATSIAAVVVEKENVEKVKRIIESEDISHLIPRDYMFRWGPEEERGDFYTMPHRMLYLIEKRADVTGQHLDTAWIDYGMTNQPVVYLRFNDVGRRVFSRLTGEHINEQLAILLEDTVFNAPTIQDKISTGSATITGIGDVMEARKTAVVLRAGALPAPLVVQESRVVGPTLGHDSISQGITSVVWGSIAVLIFMVVYYSFTGIVADIAVILNLLFLLAGMALFKATLTLPGIAGVILTIGMAVDANVLIFERLREESHGKRNQGLPLILDKSYGRAFMTIFDANITTLITALILFQFGTGPIKGFAVTLSLGIIVSMFTAVFVSRVILDVMVANGMKTLSLGSIKFFANANFNFFKAPKLCLSVTSTIGVLGFLVLIAGWNSGSLKGLDFAGGAEVFAEFTEPIDVQEVRQSLASVSLGDAMIQEVIGEDNQVLIRVREGVVSQPAELEAKIHEALPSKDFSIIGSNIVGAKVGGELLVKGLYCLLFSSIGILLYITARFEFRFAVAGVVTLFHDLLFTLAILAVMGTQFNLPIIAALLTVLGYSLNDTIVVFDRIRENYKSTILNFKEIVNLSINQTLSRTVNTSLTTLFVVMILFVFGGSVIHDFALTLIIGVVIGTYSSIFVASPVLYMMTQKRMKEKADKKKDYRPIEAS